MDLPDPSSISSYINRRPLVLELIPFPNFFPFLFTDVRRYNLRLLLLGNDDKDGGDGYIR